MIRVTTVKEVLEAVQLGAAQLKAEAGGQQTATWHLHTPDGRRVAIGTIGSFKPFVRFDLLEEETTVLVPPDAVYLSLSQQLPQPPEEVVKIGFA